MIDYLQLVRGKYRVRMKVGAWPLQRILGKATLTKALGTADHDKAERLAGPIILEFKRQIAAAQLKQLRRLTPADAFRRASQDRVYTNPALARAIIEYFRPSGRVIDPCRGFGAFFDHLPPGSEWCELTEGRDFLSYNERVNWVIGNPPWSARVYRPVARHAFELADNVVFLVRLNTAIGTTARQRDYLDRGHALKEIIPIPWEMSGFPQEGFTLAVCHWQCGWQGDTRWNYEWATKVKLGTR
jgi:hypothetical protein